MGYDITIKDRACPTCGYTTEEKRQEWGMTWNIRPMLNHAGITFQDLAELEGAELVEQLSKLANFLRASGNQPRLVALNPANGWGSLAALQGMVLQMHDFARGLDNPRFSL